MEHYKNAVFSVLISISSNVCFPVIAAKFSICRTQANNSVDKRCTLVDAGYLLPEIRNTIHHPVRQSISRSINHLISFAMALHRALCWRAWQK